MNDFTKKLRFIYLRYLLIATGTLLIYTSLRWVLDIKLNILHVKEDILDFWLPVTLPLIPIIIWLRPALRFLNIKGKRDNGHFLYIFIIAFSVIIPTIIAQEYVKALSSKLKVVGSVNEIINAKKTDCYRITNFNVDKDFVVSYGTSRTGGRDNDHLTFYRYFAVPIVDDKYPVDIIHHKYWFGIKFSEGMSNYESQSAKDDFWKSFYQDSKRKFKYYNYSDFQYLKVLGNSNDRDGFIEAIKKIETNITKNDIILFEPVEEPFEEILGNKLGWIFGSFGIGSFIFLLMVIIPSINTTEYKQFIDKKPLKDDGGKEILQFLIPRKKHIATALLIDINMLIFIGMVLSGLNIISPTPQELLVLGANRRDEVLQGEYWRLFTAMFLHGGLMHILSNAFGIAITCGPLEMAIGKWKTLGVYLISGIGANLFSIYYNENSISVGASGAIFGMIGMIGAMIVTKRVMEMSGFLIFLVGIYGGLGLLFGLVGGVDYAAHIGGLVTGFLVGLAMVVCGLMPVTKTPDNYSC